MSLPSGYVELEYIESSGTQYIDTGYAIGPDNIAKTRFVVDTALLSSANGWALHGTNNSNLNSFYVGAHSSGIYYGNGLAHASAGVAYPFGTRKRLELNGLGKYTVEDLVDLSFTSKTPTATYNLYLFAYNNANTAGKHNSRVYGCQIYESGLLVRDFIPAKTIEGEVGLYDRVFHEFYRNAGTGSFIDGPETVSEDYTELEYIESSGTQYVNTGFNPNNNTRVVLDFKIATANASAWRSVFGSRQSTSSGCFALFVAGTDSGGRANLFYSNIGNTVHWFSSNLAVTDRHVVDCNKNVVSVDGEVFSHTAVAFQSTRPLYLFANNEAGALNMLCDERIYSCQIYDNGTEVRVYVPVLHPSGVPGLWDSANERFYASATTTDLIAGPEKVFAPKAPANFRVVSETDTEVALAWDADENAAGYRLYRDGALLADLTGTEYTDTATPFGSYTYQVRGYNEHGDGDAAELVVFLSPENPILWLVTDRTQADVDARNSKGVYQSVDLNRVGAAVAYLQKRLLESGILANVTPQMDWTETRWMSAGEAKVYLDNVKTMRAALAMPKGTPAAPADMAKLTYAEANHIEMFLVILDTLLTDMVFAYRHCGTTVCGMGGLIL